MSRDPSPTGLSDIERRQLLALARRTIELGADGESMTPPPLESLPPNLRAPRATFVTLHRAGQLRGCCGSLQAREPLAWNIIRSSRSAAFGDRRFRPVERTEIPDLDLHISILSPLSKLEFLTEADLLDQLRPGVDGLLLTEPELGQQGVFLPAVWEQMPDPVQFLRRLKQKAGLPQDYWSPWITVQRFTVESISEDHTSP